MRAIINYLLSAFGLRRGDRLPRRLRSLYSPANERLASIGRDNQLILGGLIYTKLTMLVFAFSGTGAVGRFLFNAVLGLAGITSGLALKLANRLAERRLRLRAPTVDSVRGLTPDE